MTRLSKYHVVLDLVEILNRIHDNSDVTTDDARPQKVKAFLQVSGTVKPVLCAHYLVDTSNLWTGFTTIPMSCTGNFRPLNFWLIWFINQRAYTIMLCLSLSGMMSLSASASVLLSVYSPPNHMVKHRNFIFGVNMYTCP